MALPDDLTYNYGLLTEELTRVDPISDFCLNGGTSSSVVQSRINSVPVNTLLVGFATNPGCLAPRKLA